MKIGVFTVLFGEKNLEDTLDYLSGLGVEAAEIGTGAYPGSAHCSPDELLASGSSLEKFKDIFIKRNMIISALSCHGNPVHPNRSIAEEHHRAFEKTVLLAEKLGVDRVCVLSGCPGGGPKDETPNWVTCPWPDDYLKILDYQWNEVLVPYWKKAAAFAAGHGVDKICVEMHPGFCVYNTETMLRLRREVGKEIGVNFDPSHIFWQGIDPIEAIMAFGDAIYHMHAKDTVLNMRNIKYTGVLDTRHYGNVKDRSWVFRTVGYGHSDDVWKGIVSALAVTGYDHVLSIEHEDSLMAREEGLEKAVSFLKNLVIKEKPGKMWWA